MNYNIYEDDYIKFDYFDSLYFSLKYGIINIGIPQDDVENLIYKLKSELVVKNKHYVRIFDDIIYIDKRVNKKEIKTMLEDAIFCSDITDTNKDKLFSITRSITIN